MTIEEVITVLAMQEEILQFGHFTNEDAWALGNLIVAEARKRGLDTAVEIRLNNGYTVFKYAGNSTNLNNEAWMDKMYATVRRVEKSTMLLYSELKKSEETLEDIGLDPREYSYMGGGFNRYTYFYSFIYFILNLYVIILNILLFIFWAVSRYLHVDEVPRIRAL